MRREVVMIGDSAGIVITPDELAALGLQPGSQVDVALIGRCLEVSRANPYAGMSLDELMPIIEARRARP